MVAKKTAQGPPARSKAKKAESGTTPPTPVGTDKKSPVAPVKKAVAKKATKKATSSKAGAQRADALPPVPNAMGLLASHSDYTTHNFEEVRRFYTQQLGFTRFQFDPNFRYLWIQTSHQSSLGFVPPIPGGEKPLPPREPTIYFMVEDIDESFRKLQARGVSFEAPPETMPWGHRIVRTRDPEGRSITLAQDLNRDK